jgi:ABC-type transporter Mla subunit MlaD
MTEQYLPPPNVDRRNSPSTPPPDWNEVIKAIANHEARLSATERTIGKLEVAIDRLTDAQEKMKTRVTQLSAVALTIYALFSDNGGEIVRNMIGAG